MGDEDLGLFQLLDLRYFLTRTFQVIETKINTPRRFKPEMVQTHVIQGKPWWLDMLLSASIGASCEPSVFNVSI